MVLIHLAPNMVIRSKKLTELATIQFGDISRIVLLITRTFILHRKFVCSFSDAVSC